MKNISNKGFVLAELLIVCVFLMIIFSMLYSNYLPLQGQYEVREGYDDVDSKYAVYWIKRMIEDLDYQPLDAGVEGYNHSYAQFDCDNFKKTTGSTEEQTKSDIKVGMCKTMLKSMHVECKVNDNDDCKVYITRYNLTAFKNAYPDDANLSKDEAFYDYLFYLPNYNTPSLNNAAYRVTAKFKTGNVVSYSTIEVNR